MGPGQKSRSLEDGRSEQVVGEKKLKGKKKSLFLWRFLNDLIRACSPIRISAVFGACETPCAQMNPVVMNLIIMTH